MTDIMNIPRSELESIYALIGKRLGAPTEIVSTGKVSKKVEKAEKKPRANAGQSTAHGDYTKKVLAEHNKDSAEYKEFVAKRVAAAEAGKLAYTADQGKVKSGKKQVGDLMDAKEARSGAHIAFVGFWKASQQEEWLAFKADWETTHPKSSRASSVADDASTAGSETKPGKKRGAKKDAECTPEELAERKAKRAAKKAEKNAAKEPVAEVAEPASSEDEQEQEEVIPEDDAEEAESQEAAAESEEAEEVEFAFIPFEHKKVKYLRLGNKVDEEIEWEDDGHLWKALADGSKGAYAGKLLSNGKIDSSAETMKNEPASE